MYLYLMILMILMIKGENSMSMDIAIENLKNAIEEQRRIDGTVRNATEIRESEIQDADRLWHEFSRRGSLQSRKARKVIV